MDFSTDPVSQATRRDPLSPGSDGGGGRDADGGTGGAGTGGGGGPPAASDRYGGSSGRAADRAGAEPADEWARFKEEVIHIAKPALQLPFERGEISRDVFKQILRKVAEKVVKGYQLEGLPAPKPSELPAKQVGKIEKLAHEYVVLLKKA